MKRILSAVAVLLLAATAASASPSYLIQPSANDIRNAQKNYVERLGYVVIQQNAARRNSETNEPSKDTTVKIIWLCDQKTLHCDPFDLYTVDDTVKVQK